MLATIIRKEIYENIQTVRFAISVGLCVILFGLNAFVLKERYLHQVENYDKGIALYETWAKKYASPNSMTQFAEKRPAHLMLFFSEPRVQINKEIGQYIVNSPLDVLFKDVDFAKAAGLFLSLIAILFGYDAIVGERAKGTLKLMLAAGASKAQILLGKLLGALCVIAVPFLLSFLVALLIGLEGGVAAFSGEDWLGIGLFLIAALIYLAVVLCGSLWVSVRSRTRGGAMLTLLVVWTALVLVLPNILPYASAWLRPISSRWDIERDISAMDKDREQRANQAIAQYAQAHPGADIGRWAVSRESGIFEDVITTTDRILQKWGGYFRKLEEQITLGLNMSRISPFSNLLSISRNLSHTGTREMMAFQRASWEYLAKGVKFQLNLLKQDVVEGRNPNEPRDLSKIIPRFDYRYLSFSKCLEDSLVDLLMLVGWSVVLYMIAYIAWIRRDDV